MENPYLKIGEENDRSKKGISEYVWALKNINFEVKHGEVLGIIGRNGAGKSTLLKILSRTTTPTTGSVKIKGRVASLLEVGTGFHPDLSGRENIFLNGAILGMTKKEIKSKFDEIVDFAGVERYIDTPVKRYSSGMYVRLAFGVAAHLEPEILIVDEVLAVGDAEFQKKALGKMKDVSKMDGRTVLFVSHNMTAIKNLCPSAIYLDNGTIKYSGDTNKAISLYFNIAEASKLNGEIPGNFVRLNTGDAKITSFTLLNEKKIVASQFFYNEKLTVKMSIETFTAIPDALIDIKIVSDDGNPFSHCINTDDESKPYSLDKGKHSFEIVIDNILHPGIYKINVGIHFLSGRSIDYLEQICEFEVLRLGKIKDYKYDWVHGYINLPSVWNQLS